MDRLSFNDLAAGQMFTYEGRRQLFKRGVGIGQVLGLDPERMLVFVELFGTRDDQLVPFIGFAPLTYDAFVQSDPQMTKILDVPESWEGRRSLWLTKWRTGEAGAFSISLREVVSKTMKTVGRTRAIDEGKIYIEVAFPRRDTSGAFRTIEALAVPLA